MTVALFVVSASIGGAFLVAVVARYKHVALWCAIPLLLWPTMPIQLKVAVVAVLGVGTVLGSLSRLRLARKPIWLYVGFVAVMTFGFLVHAPPVTATPSEARNSFIALLLNLALVPVIALSRPPFVTTLKVLGLSGVVASAYLLRYSETVGSRVGLVDYNSDVLGTAAALAILALVAVFAATGERRWLPPAVLPLALFLAAQTRSALVILVLGLGLFWLLRRASPVRVVVVCVMLAAIPFLAKAALAGERILFASRDARHLEVQSRIDTLKLALKTAVENPLLGVGWRHFTDESLQHLGFVINAHNDYALIAAEGGLIALVLFAGLMLRAVTFRDATREGTALRAVLIAALAGLAFGNLVTDLRVMLSVWVLLGLAWASHRNPGSALSDADPPTAQVIAPYTAM